MLNNGKLQQRFWDRYGKREILRDRNPEKIVHTAQTWQAIESCLKDRHPEETFILDAGAGPGRFSIPLASRGYKVTHLDISPRMLKIARQAAERAGVIDMMEFLEGRVEDLAGLQSRSFDLVLSLDAPISYATVPQQAVQELARVCRGYLVATVVNWSGQLPIAIMSELKVGKKLGLSWRFWQDGQWEPEKMFPDLLDSIPNQLVRYLVSVAAGWALQAGYTFPPVKAFHPAELIQMFQATGASVLNISAPGTLARLLPLKTLKKIVSNKSLLEEFLALASEYDAQPEVLGIGAQTASGLLVVARCTP